MSTADPCPLEALRLQFPVVERVTYLNHAAVSPLPLRCRAGVEAYLEELGGWGAANYERVIGTLRRVRRACAALLGARPANVFIVRSTTQGLAVAATGLPVREGDNVVLVEREFPANLRPWLPLRRRGVELRLVPQAQGRVRIDDLRRAVDRRTAALSISFVQFLSGFRVDLAPIGELCRAHDALLVVDAIQGLGAFPLDVEALGVDLLSADAHKWLLGPEGVGVGYASDRALARIEPAVEGWLSVERPFDFFDLEQPLKAGAARFEEGAYNMAGIYGLEGSLELLASMGPERIVRRLIALTDHLCAGLEGAGWQVSSPRAAEGEKSGIVLTTRQGVDFDALGGWLRDHDVVASVRGGALRLSPHAYNTEAELDHVVELLAGGTGLPACT